MSLLFKLCEYDFKKKQRSHRYLFQHIEYFQLMVPSILPWLPYTAEYWFREAGRNIWILPRRLFAHRIIPTKNLNMVYMFVYVCAYVSYIIGKIHDQY